MATKKKAAKKATKMKAFQIFIQLDGTPYPANPPLDGNAKKHSSKVFWQALDNTQSYQIVLVSPPAPFKNGLGLFPTDNYGTTQTLMVDKKYPNGLYRYVNTFRTDSVGRVGGNRQVQ